MTRFNGIWVPLVTPFRDGALDLPALQALARRLAGGGIAGLVACGTTGEAAALDENEQLALLDAVLDAATGVPVVMGLCDNNLQSMLARVRALGRRPVAGLLVPPPYYIRPTQAGIADFFRAVADASEAPLIVYNIPYRAGVAMEWDTLRALAEHPRIAAVKDCSGNLALTMRLIADGKLAVLAGEDQQILSTLCLGGAGAIAASAHLRPDLFAQLPALVQAGRLEEARAIFYRLLPLIEDLFAEPNPGPLKAALAMTGALRDELRAPMTPASDALRGKLAQHLRRLECL